MRRPIAFFLSTTLSTAALITPACSQFGEAGNASSSSSGNDDGGGHDAVADGLTTSDAFTDGARASDGEGNDGALADGSEASVAARFCQNVPDAGVTPVYCRDFDDGTDVLVGWDDVTQAMSSAVTLDQFVSASAPGSFHARSVLSGPCQSARTIKNLHNQPRYLHVASDILVGGAGSDPDGSTFLQFNVGQCTLSFGLTATTATMDLLVSGNTIPSVSSVAPPLGMWTHFDLMVDQIGGVTNVYFNQVKAISTLLSAECLNTTKDVLVTPGVSCEDVSNNTPRDVHIDNLVVFTSNNPL